TSADSPPSNRPSIPANRYHSGDIISYAFIDGHVEGLNPAKTVGRVGTLSAPQGMWTITNRD
ncbi:MAG TPA: hypothetical protein VK968_08250, partial [Roseimicrobium sp.]|nr:hypothetical protein [Roseimicrobium sp.]